MREITFRAWDIDNKQFIYAHIGQDDVWLDDGISTIEIPLHHSDFEQYTGLKDKNGKEIYEGDIIEEEIDLGYETSVHRYIVKYDEDLLCWSLDKSNSFHEFLYETNLSRQVIGNIHENAELLG